MKKGIGLVILMFFWVVWVSISSGYCLAIERFPFVSGEQLYKTHCSVCHNGAVKEAPRFESLQLLSSAAIVKALRSGVMKAQGASLSLKEHELIASYISILGQTKTALIAGKCNQANQKVALRPIVSNWGMGLTNQRFFDNKEIQIDANNVNKLAVKWAFAFPDATRARAQPTVAGNTLFTASQHGTIYALDRATGCIRWTFQAEEEVRSAIVVGTDSKGNANRLYFGDLKANVYALDIQSQKLLWKKKVDSHEQAIITGSLSLYQNRLYVPVSSAEVVAAYNPSYPCCTFRGSVVALNASTGDQHWKTYTTEPATPQAHNSAGTQNYGPSGAPVWSSPTIDTVRGLLYVGTGENYSRPSSLTSDAIIAMSLETGQIKWVRQTVGQDSWNGACTTPDGANCPENHGPDYDFGAPPILIKRAGQADLILAGQKSGMVYALNPDADGAIVWQTRVGRGGIMGGVHWGMASDGQQLYVPINDRDVWPQDKDKPAFPGLHAVQVSDGKILWSKIEQNRCKDDVKWVCGAGLSAPISLIKGVVFGGALDGVLHAYSTQDGHVLWEYDTNRSYQSVNGVAASGGTIDSAGPVVVGNQMFINSGYAKFGEKAGNVLLCFELLPTSTVKGINHVSVSVTDLDRSVQFYKNTIELNELSKTSISSAVAVEQAAGFKHVNRKVAILNSANAHIELNQFEGNKQPCTMPIPGPGITHVCFQSPAANPIYAKSKSLGATIVSRGSAPVDRGFGIQYAYIRDQDNILFEMEQLDKPTFSENCWVGHVAIVTHDIDRLVAFYTQLLGNKPHNRVDNIKNSPKLDDIANMDSLKLRGAWFKVGNMQLEMWQFDNPPIKAAEHPRSFTQTGYQKISLEVGDLASEYKRLSEIGVRFLSKPVTTKERSEVFLRDPDGNLLLLQEFKTNNPRSVDSLKKIN